MKSTLLLVALIGLVLVSCGVDKDSDPKPTTRQSQIDIKETWVTACDVGTRLLTSPGGNTPIARIPAGTKLLVIEKKNVQMGMVTAPWYKVKYAGKTGWISSFSTKEGEN